MDMESDSSLSTGGFPPCLVPPEAPPQLQGVFDLQELQRFLDAVPDAFLILDDQRRIVFANAAFGSFLGLKDAQCIGGLRPGDAFDCIHAINSTGGCGSTQACQMCGAAQAIRSSLDTNQTAVQECRISRRNGEALDLRVWGTPLLIGDKHFTMFAVRDISHEKRRRALERIFFHDILNTAGAVQGYAEMLAEAAPEEVEELTTKLQNATQLLVDEVKAQRELQAAENGELSTTPAPLDTREFIEEIASLYRNHSVASGMNIAIRPESQPLKMLTDKTLLRRVLGNMVKNALEASVEGQTVELSCQAQDGQVVFEVHNPGFMAHEVQLQVFQRSFSTKARDRGLGTYSMKLLSERYLGGKVRFHSTQQSGTVFQAIYPLGL